MWHIFRRAAKNSRLWEIGSLPRSGGAISYNLQPVRGQNPSSSACGSFGGLASWFPLHILLSVPHFTGDYPGLCSISSFRITFHKMIKSDHKIKWGGKETSGFQASSLRHLWFYTPWRVMARRKEEENNMGEIMRFLTFSNLFCLACCPQGPTMLSQMTYFIFSVAE